jgi:hypothetical protein
MYPIMYREQANARVADHHRQAHHSSPGALISREPGAAQTQLLRPWPPPQPPPPLPPPPPPPPAFAPAQYIFSLDTMNAAWLCSAFFDDQDHFVGTVQLNRTAPEQVSVPKPGVGAGMHNLGIEMPAISTTNAHDMVLFNYSIVNSAAQMDAIETALKGLLAGLITDGANAGIAASGVLAPVVVAMGAAGSAVMPVVGTIIGALAGLAITAGLEALFNNCANMVAAEQVGFSAEYLWNATHRGDEAISLTVQTQHPGLTPRTIACQRSYYETTWTCRRV